ncbi:siroheme decarboxylase subunit alpha [Desulfothermus naphthae]
MDQKDRDILDIIQSEFPICSRPYAEIGKLVGLTEAEVLARVRKLGQKGIIRRIGANFQSRKLGWKSTLCCAKVPEDKLDLFVETVNKYPGVTHNYLRKHEFNVWFTYIAPSWEDIDRDLKEMEKQTGIKILSLPATKMLKVKVDFKMNSD